MRHLAKLARLLTPTQGFLLFALQSLAFLAVLVGISFWSDGAACIVGGIAVIAAVELQDAGPMDSAESDAAMRKHIEDVIKSGNNPFEHGVPQTEKWMRYVDIITRPLTFPTGIKG